MPDKKPDPMQELKGMHIWMLWEWAADKDGKMTKKPMGAPAAQMKNSAADG